MRRIVFAVLLLLLMTGASAAQSKNKGLVLIRPTPLPAPTPTPKPEEPPGKIHLLDNYQYEPGRGIDTWKGSFVRTDGFKIQFENGALAANYASDEAVKRKGEVRWYKLLRLESAFVVVALFKDGQVMASFEKRKPYHYAANFFAMTKSDEDVAEFLLTVLTYSP